jgi:hypothetical protein
MKWLLLLLLGGSIANADLAPRVMDGLALQIPGISTGTTTPIQMHEAWRRYEAMVDILTKESFAYRTACYKVLFKHEMNTGKELYMVYGGTPNDVCDYFSRRFKSGYAVPSIDNLKPKGKRNGVNSDIIN